MRELGADPPRLPHPTEARALRPPACQRHFSMRAKPSAAKLPKQHGKANLAWSWVTRNSLRLFPATLSLLQSLHGSSSPSPASSSSVPTSLPQPRTAALGDLTLTSVDGAARGPAPPAAAAPPSAGLRFRSPTLTGFGVPLACATSPLPSAPTPSPPFASQHLGARSSLHMPLLGLLLVAALHVSARRKSIFAHVTGWRVKEEGLDCKRSAWCWGVPVCMIRYV